MNAKSVHDESIADSLLCLILHPFGDALQTHTYDHSRNMFRLVFDSVSITQLCGVEPLQLLNSDQCAQHSLRREEPPSTETKAPRQGSVMEPPRCRPPRRKGGQRWIALDIPSARGRRRRRARDESRRPCSSRFSKKSTQIQ